MYKSDRLWRRVAVTKLLDQVSGYLYELMSFLFPFSDFRCLSALSCLPVTHDMIRSYDTLWRMTLVAPSPKDTV